MEGDRIGPVGGDVESDGKNLGVTLKAERNETFEVFRMRRHLLRQQLGTFPWHCSISPWPGGGECPGFPAGGWT